MLLYANKWAYCCIGTTVLHYQDTTASAFYHLLDHTTQGLLGGIVIVGEPLQRYPAQYSSAVSLTWDELVPCDLGDLTEFNASFALAVLALEVLLGLILSGFAGYSIAIRLGTDLLRQFGVVQVEVEQQMVILC